MKKKIWFGIVVTLIVGISFFPLFFRFFYPKRYMKTKQGDYIKIDSMSKDDVFPIQKDCVFVIEHYYPEEDRVWKETVSYIPEMLGYNKEELEHYLKNYMSILSREEKEKGLVSYNLVGYSGNQITLRKTYKQKNKENGYYAKSFNGTIVILKSDGKTVYEYTPILIQNLPMDLQEKMQHGYYFENEEALYNFLENYSS